MSYDVTLLHPDTDELAKMNRLNETKGGIFEMYGSLENPYLNVTWNYSRLFRATLDSLGINWLHLKTVRETLPKLREAVKILGVEESGDYWEVTAGNAGAALANLIFLAESVDQDSIWNVI